MDRRAFGPVFLLMKMWPAQGHNPVLVYAVYPTIHGARDIFETMERAQRGKPAKTDAFAVISIYIGGPVPDRTTQQVDAF
jgi:hypothetical protein